MATRPLKRVGVWISALGCVLTLVVGMPVARAASTAQIIGGGSSWAGNAVNQWASDVTSRGLQVFYAGPYGQDFAVTDVPYQYSNPAASGGVYVPIAAGATTFPYHLVTASGGLVRTLRLSGLTLAEIFTNQIHDLERPAASQLKTILASLLPELADHAGRRCAGVGQHVWRSPNIWRRSFQSIWTAYNGGSDTPTPYLPDQGQCRWPRTGPEYGRERYVYIVQPRRDRDLTPV